MANRKIGGRMNVSFSSNNGRVSNNQRRQGSYSNRENYNQKPQGTQSKVSMDFVNPYNFIDVDLNKTTKVSIAESEDIISGYLDCNVACKTHLLIPEHVENENDTSEHKYKEFMHISDSKGEKKYFIPGSSLRGVIRNVYETITDSCFSTLNNSKMLSSRTTIPSKPGLLVKENDEWRLYTANQYNIDVSVPDPDDKGNVSIKIKGDTIFPGSAVSFSKYYHKGDGNIKECDINRADISEVIKERNGTMGFLVIGGEPRISKEHYTKVFTFKERQSTIVIKEGDKYWDSLFNTIKDYCDEKSNQKYYAGKKAKGGRHHGYKYLEKSVKEGVIPVWINKGKDNNSKQFYLQPACIGRRTYYKTFEKLMKEKKPCELVRKKKGWENEKQLCSACKLFGTVKQDAIGSRLRFTDAGMINGKVSDSFKTLSILSGPKPTFLPFYAKIKNGSGDISFEGYDNDQVSIKGRKYYLHSDDFENLNKDVPQSNQNISAKLAEKNSEFRFRIYFEKITKTDLFKLMWAVNLGENDKAGKYCHKIGHGKPIGLGSVKITVEKIAERSFKDGKYIEKERDDILQYLAQTDKRADVIKELELACTDELEHICDFELAKSLNKKKGIHYPNDGFKWFAQFNKVGKPIESVLPKYSEIIKKEKLGQ